MDDVGADTPLVRVVWGTGTGPTAIASYDAALAAANVHDYNLTTVSSVVPPGATVEAIGTAPDLGPAGDRLWVLESRFTVRDVGRATAAVGWATGEGAGLIYEAAGELSGKAAREQVIEGLAKGRGLRDRHLAIGDVRSVSIEASPGNFSTAIMLAVFGTSEPMF